MMTDETRVELLVEKMTEILSFGSELGVDLSAEMNAAARLVLGKAGSLDADTSPVLLVSSVRVG